jgi:hypothetical protein
MTDEDLIDLLRTCTPRPLPSAVSAYVHPIPRPNRRRRCMAWVSAAVAAASILLVVHVENFRHRAPDPLPTLGRYRHAAHENEETLLQLVDADALRFHTAHHPEGVDP